MPSTNRAEQVREYRATSWLFANIGVIAGSPTSDLQIEVQNLQVLEETSRRGLLIDLETRICHAGVGALAGAAIGLAWGTRIGQSWFGLLVGLLVGAFFGFLAPTDWIDLVASFFGATSVSFFLAIV